MAKWRILLPPLKFSSTHFLTCTSKGFFPDSVSAADIGRWRAYRKFLVGLTRVSFPGFSAYSAAKGAVETPTVYMAKELGSRGITVNTVAPGAIETDFLGGAVRDLPEYNKAFSDMTALGRVGVPDDIGPMVASLLSPSNRWVTGQLIKVSGGQTI